MAVKVGPDFTIKPLLPTSGIVIICGATVKLLEAFNKAALEDVDPIGPCIPTVPWIPEVP